MGVAEAGEEHEGRGADMRAWSEIEQVHTWHSVFYLQVWEELEW